MKLNDNVQYLKGVGERRAWLLQRLGIRTVGDLLRFYPRAYEDWSKIVKIEDAVLNEVCCVKAIVDSKPRENMIRKGLTIYKTEVTDGKSLMQITVFNSKYTAQKLIEGEEFLFFGRVGGNLWKKEMSNPLVAPAIGGDTIHPIYPLTEGLTSAVVTKIVRAALDDTLDELCECLPQTLRDKYCLCGVKQAVKNIHFPADADYLEHARTRLIFEELLLLQLGLMGLKSQSRGESSSVVEKDYTKEFLSLLPFRATNAQKAAVAQCASDMAGKIPMNRLLQGDVGSGKTAVAAALVYSAAKNGVQSALMAPTEILAQQHYKTFLSLFEGTNIVCELITGSVKAQKKREIKQRLSQGEIDLLIGTHAIIQQDVSFEKLGLVITDEQHRFGVAQRSILSQKGGNPHTLVMSATPIPRTLALIIYGDLDISVLDELPPGRIPVETYCITGDKRIRAFNYIKKHLDEGRQGYIVCPLVEEGEQAQLAAAEEYAQGLSAGQFVAYSVGLLHGRMKSADKERVMSDFAQGKIQLLVSTTVIEVGVDVPNAVIMLIENAERFGLSQLHQLRGRIGRGRAASTCILVSDAQNDDAKKRLKVMCETSDGFKIADEDLRLRGPGDFFGSRQHGLPELKIADMLTDTEILREANAAAREIISNDPWLESQENSELKKCVDELFSRVGTGAMN